MSQIESASAEEIEVAKAVLAGWSIVPDGGAPWSRYYLVDHDGTYRGSFVTRYTAACRANALIAKAGQV
jgi:hypothetical protein